MSEGQEPFKFSYNIGHGRDKAVVAYQTGKSNWGQTPEEI